MLKLFPRRANEHVPHEEGMVGSGADDPDIDTVTLVPSCEAIDNIDTIPGIQVVDCAFSVDFPDLQDRSA